jgi:L-lactate dehydrogenase (cytochrome)
MGFFGNKACEACFNIADLRELARKKLPPPFFDLLDGGADDEVTLRRNTQAFESYDVLPRTLVDVGKIDTSTTVLGQEIQWPVYISPALAQDIIRNRGWVYTVKSSRNP